MGNCKVRNTGDKYRPIVTVKKLKGDVPTVLQVSGRRYVLETHKINREGKK